MQVLPPKNSFLTKQEFGGLLRCIWKSLSSDIDNATSYSDVEIYSEINIFPMLFTASKSSLAGS